MRKLVPTSVDIPGRMDGGHRHGRGMNLSRQQASRAAAMGQRAELIPVVVVLGGCRFQVLRGMLQQVQIFCHQVRMC